jgi:hypothetical protein
MLGQENDCAVGIDATIGVQVCGKKVDHRALVFDNEGRVSPDNVATPCILRCPPTSPHGRTDLARSGL